MSLLKKSGLALFAGALFPFAFWPIGIALLSILSLSLFFIALNDLKTRSCPHYAISKRNALNVRESQRSIHVVCEPRVAENQGGTAEIVVMSTQSKKSAAFLGFLYGIALFGVGASWIYRSIHDYGQAAPLLAGFLTLLFVLALSCFTAVMAFVYQSLFSNALRINKVLGFSFLWVIFEWIRGCFLTGFPWLFVGVSQIDTPLAGYAPLLGVYGVSLITTFIAALAACLFKSTQKQMLWQIGTIMLLIASGFYCRTLEFTHPKAMMDFALLQGNVAQTIKWDPNHAHATLKAYKALIQSVEENTLIILPEAAFPIPLPQSQDFVDTLEKIAAIKHQTILFGAPVSDTHGRYYNALIATGMYNDVYFKKLLVPFGEFVPFESLLRGLIGFFDLPMSAFIPGADNKLILQLGPLTVAPLICYEIAYPEAVRNSAKLSNVIVTVSDDSWFGHSFGPTQHLEIAAFRALENQKYVLRTTNTGITALINEKGKVVAKLPRDKIAILTGNFEVREGMTPWNKLGTRTMIGLCFILMLTLALFELRRALRK